MKTLHRSMAVLLISFLPLQLSAATAPATPTSWSQALKSTIARIDEKTPGNLGVYIKKLSDKAEVNYQADRDWYLASTVKIPVAIATLEKVEEGSLKLDHEITLQASDFVDGSGEVIAKEPGTRLSVRYLLEKMLTESDSSATDILIRLIGLDDLNRRIKTKMGAKEFRPVTTLLQVRYDAYGEVHPNAEKLTNLDFIELKRFKAGGDRMRALLKKMGVKPGEAKARSLDEAFERYYARDLNSAPLSEFGGLLERLASGKVLNPENTELVLSLMEKMVTGENRIKAGLPKNVSFAQKTGTQNRRICNVGLLRKKDSKQTKPIVVAACMEKFDDQKTAEKALKELGQAIAGSGLLNE